MNAILNLMRRLNDDQLLGLSEAIDVELDRRIEREDPIPGSTRRRAVDRQYSYRRSNGAHAMPARMVDQRPPLRRRLAA
jgi:hypothetical protein